MSIIERHCYRMSTGYYSIYDNGEWLSQCRAYQARQSVHGAVPILRHLKFPIKFIHSHNDPFSSSIYHFLPHIFNNYRQLDAIIRLYPYH